MTMPAPSSNAEVPIALLRSLPGVGFVPPERGTASPSAETLVLRAAVDDFARRFWELAPADRRAEWSALSARTRDDPRCYVRLNRLEPHLDLAGGPADDAPQPARAIESALRTLATLAPPDQAVRRAEFVRTLSPPPGQWQKTALAIRSRRPEIAALDPALIDSLATMGAGKRGPTRPFPETFQQMASPEWNANVEPATSQSASPAPARSPPRSGSSISVVVIIIVVINLIRLAAQSTGRNTTNPPRQVLPPSAVENWQPKDPGLDWEKHKQWRDEMDQLTQELLKKVKTQPPADVPTPKPPS